MNNQKEAIKKSGQFIANDKQGVPVILEWQKTTLFAPEYAAVMKEIWTLACAAYLPVEMKFLRTFPQVVGTEDYYKPFEPFFKDGLHAVDWGKVEEVMQALLKSHFIFDASTWGPEVTVMYAKDVCYVITIKDQQTNVLLGVITLIKRANYAQGDIKVMSVAVDPKHQRRGLATLLMSSIFRIMPDIKRTFMCTRVTNDAMLQACTLWGFTPDEHPILDHPFNLDHWKFFEYNADKVNVLQKIAAKLKPV